MSFLRPFSQSIFAVIAALVLACVSAAPHNSIASIPARDFFYAVETPAYEPVSVYEAMSKLAAESDFTFSAKKHAALGFFVEDINGIKNADGYYWTLYINGRYSLVGASRAQVRPGDIIDWKYEKK